MGKLRIIYEPSGPAREYAPLAVNLKVGCEHGCRYCYGPAAFHKKRESFHSNPWTREQALEKLEHDAELLRGDDREILLSFATDPYGPDEPETRLTRQALEILIANGLRFTVLTKGGVRACRDFGLMAKYDKCTFGTTLVLNSQEDADYWEPNAAPIVDRIEAIRTAHQMRIPVWVSLEPVIYPEQAIALVKSLRYFVGHWKIGKLNYNREVAGKVDWPGFKKEITSVLDRRRADYYLKNGLAEL